MNTAPHILFAAYPGDLQDWFWRGRSKQRAKELGYTVQLNTQPAPLAADQWAELLTGVEALLTTWDSPRLDDAILSRNTTLRIVGHVGGSVAPIVSPALFDRGITVCTANGLMARTLAEWNLMATLMGLRRLIDYAQFGAGGRSLEWEARQSTVVPADAVIGIWGYGDVAQWLIRLLRPFEPKEILVYDEFLNPAKAISLGIRKVEFNTLFKTADMVHCLTGLTPATKGKIGPQQLAALKDNAILVNAGRAALIQENALIDELAQNRITAIMDVYHTEPLPVDHPYRSMPNLILTPHNAGSGRDELYLGAMLDEFARFFRGEPLLTEVDPTRAIHMTDPALTR
jgi:phosphoglycerate dehydrogenase-like enzyme